MYKDRAALLTALEERLDSKVLLYVTSDRRGYETQIGQDVIEIIARHLETIQGGDKLALYLYTRGGDTAAAWNIVNLIREYFNDLQVVVPRKAHSAGTLISIGANAIVMTKQATLSPIDPSVNTPLNPPIPAIPNKTMPVSVEAVKGYLGFAKDELGITDDAALANIMLKLSDFVHPLVLGQVYRSRAQIKMLAEKLLVNQIDDGAKMQKIIAFLCSDSGSHDYTINRTEAAEGLGLNIIKPDQQLESLIKDIYDDISTELGIDVPLDPRALLATNGGSYAIKRALIESVEGGSEAFVSIGKVSAQPKDGKMSISDERQFEGWRHEA